MTLTSTTRLALATAAGLLALTGLNACADDDAGMSAAACDAYADAQAAFFGDPSAIGASFGALADAVPSKLAADARTLATAAGSDDPTAFEAPAVTQAAGRLGDAAYGGCTTSQRVDVRGVDYAFEGLPSQVRSGRVALRLANATSSDQPHEMVVVQGAAGQSADELRDLPMAELMEQARPVAVAFAATKGARATTLVDLQPGSYLVLCSLPVPGAEPTDPSMPPSDTHAGHGMVATLTVA